ncbi:family 20 glycosylhydrolase [Saliphagus infecundisoli]|uniref:beta-N-acetylhexosaminidase n=1 Tax=Saliphagus infecundisoli TaxID=1849069 RepID=A0ABD5QB24_9EURY|nr:family 20 glycosylhydrolase [Saliphagus infecundisoli]
MTEPPVLPRPRHVRRGSDVVRIEPPFRISSSGGDVDPAASLLGDLLKRETTEPSRRIEAGVEGADVQLEIIKKPSERFDDPEGYVLRADPDADAVEIRSATTAGLRHGCQSLVTALVRDGERWTLPAGKIHDWPETNWRGLMLDPARGFLSVERVKRRIDQAARAKLNRLHLHLLDDEGYALESTAYPELNRDLDGSERPAYSPDDVEELVAYAGRRGIEIVPEIDVPAHAEHVLERHPELRCTVPDGEPSDRTICIGSEESYEFLETLLEEVIEVFPFEVVHLGGDEWEMHGHSWEECADCRERMAAEGFETPTDHFYSFVRRLHGFLESHDRRTMLWNDQIDVSESPDLPRNILIQFWRVAAPGRGPVDGCSMARFVEEGFEVVNSYVHAAYVRGWIGEEYMRGWAPRRRPSVPEGRESMVGGGELAAWEPSSEERRQYFERALPSAIPLFADRLWNPDPVEGGSAISSTVTRHALGPFVPDGGDVYRELGGLILPTNWKRSDPDPPAHPDRSLPDLSPTEARSEYEETIETLTGLRDSGRVVYPETASAYVDALEWLLEVAERDGRGVLDRP